MKLIWLLLILLITCYAEDTLNVEWKYEGSTFYTILTNHPVSSIDNKNFYETYCKLSLERKYFIISMIYIDKITEGVYLSYEEICKELK